MKQFQISYIFFLLTMFFISTNINAQNDSLKSKIEFISETAKGKVGVAIIGVEDGDTLTINGDSKFPMQSVFKFPLALAVLDQVDKGNLSLKQFITVKAKDLLPNTWSPLRDKYPGGNVELTLDEIIAATVSQSDNNGCDILFRLVGGPGKVNEYIHNLGITDIAIVNTEEEMHKDWNAQFRNWSSPSAMRELLLMFFQGKVISKESTEYLWKIMVETKTGIKRIKGLLPEGTIVAHKTGSSGTNEEGIVAASNDVGIVTLPDGNHFIIVAFVSNSKTKEDKCEEVIAKIAKTVWDWELSR